MFVLDSPIAEGAVGKHKTHRIYRFSAVRPFLTVQFMLEGTSRHLSLKKIIGYADLILAMVLFFIYKLIICSHKRRYSGIFSILNTTQERPHQHGSITEN